ncbi:MAG: DHH family phosphoesterase [Candidatus Hodarchaeales archaeon]|jgi:RecJ-like exonuclease
MAAAETDNILDFLKDVERATFFLKSHVEKMQSFPPIIRVINHFDADGICSGGILSLALSRKGFLFRTTTLPNLEVADVKKLKMERNWDILIFADLGSSKAHHIQKLMTRPVIILDHHNPIVTENTEDFYQVNPHLQGIDGSIAISGAGVSYLFTKALSPVNIDLSVFAVIGALGDRQDNAEIGRLGGVNTLIVEDAKRQKLLSDEEDLWFYGHETRDLVHSLLGLNIRGLDRRQRIVNFLEMIQIPTMEGKRSRTLSDLSHGEKTQLFSELIKQYDIKPEGVFRPVYELLNETKRTLLRDGKEFASTLNSAGRLGKANIGIALIMGDRKKALNEAMKLRDEYRKKIGAYLKWCNEHGRDHIKELSQIIYVNAGQQIDREMIGTITSILSSGKNDFWTKKILTGISGNPNSGYKISVRVPARLQNQKSWQKIILSNILTDSAIDKIENSDVGGHSAAAGAILPPGNHDIDMLMVDLNQLIEKSLNDNSGEEE